MIQIPYDRGNVAELEATTDKYSHLSQSRLVYHVSHFDNGLNGDVQTTIGISKP